MTRIIILITALNCRQDCREAEQTEEELHHPDESLCRRLPHLEVAATRSNFVLILECKDVLILDRKDVLILECKDVLILDRKDVLILECKDVLILDRKDVLILDCKDVLILDCKDLSARCPEAVQRKQCGLLSRSVPVADCLATKCPAAM